MSAMYRAALFVLMAAVLSACAGTTADQEYDEQFLDIAKLQAEVDCKDVPKILELAIAVNEKWKSKYKEYDSRDLMIKYPYDKYDGDAEYERLGRYFYYLEWRVDKFAECVGAMDDNKYVDLYIDFIRSYENHAIETYTFSFALLYTLKSDYIDHYISSANIKEKEFLLDSLWWGLKNMAYHENEDNIYSKMLRHAGALYPEKWKQSEQELKQWQEEHGYK